MRFQPIYDIAEICARKGLDQVVLCPGSRCAPLTLAFTKHTHHQVYTISDERSAGFIALGLAQELKKPTIIICTSGTASYNLSPAIAEAFFNHVPLIILTADRPQEWIFQQDGQTIDQPHLYGAHVKQSFNLPQEYEHRDDRWKINRVINEAINLSQQEPAGPVHINIPLREPLYPSNNEEITFSDEARVIEETLSNRSLLETEKQNLLREWLQYHNILVVGGQQDFNESLIISLKKFSIQHAVPVVGDIISNLHPLEDLIRHADAFLGQASTDVKKSLRPDLLITFGKSVLSKNLKQFLRYYTPKSHWHIQEEGYVADTFQHVTKIIRTSATAFFDLIYDIRNEESFENQKQQNYNKLWEVEERRIVRSLREFFPQKDLGEFEIVQEVIRKLPNPVNLHLANSMSVRYANFIGLESSQAGVKVYSNRGTSGIDGCMSTTVGHCLANPTPNVLITGDLAFFYDRNALWHNYPIPNLRIVLLNNHGGVIFKMIDGPGDLPEMDEFFVTHQKLNARHTCEEFGIEYLKLDNRRKIKNMLTDFFDFEGRPKLMEIETSAQISKTIYENFKQQIKNSYDL